MKYNLRSLSLVLIGWLLVSLPTYSLKMVHAPIKSVRMVKGQKEPVVTYSPSTKSTSQARQADDCSLKLIFHAQETACAGSPTSLNMISGVETNGIPCTDVYYLGPVDIELSDASGSFTNLIKLGSGPTITAVLKAFAEGNYSFPADLPTGTNYKIRIRIVPAEFYTDEAGPFIISSSTTPTLVSSGTLTCTSSVTLTAEGGGGFSFSGPGIVSQDKSAGTAEVNAPGSYTVTNGCNLSATTEVTGTPPMTQEPTFVLKGALPIFQNTPFVALLITGCEGGTVNWQGPNGTSGHGTTISVPTSATGILVYSATCTLGSCTSSPGSATVVVQSPTETGSFDGFIYGADCATFRGWAWDRNKINTVQSVQILDGPKVLATIPANEFRQDLKDAGKGNGIHTFRWSITDELKDGQVHYLSARVANSGFILKDSPKALICQGGTTAAPNKQPVAPTMTPLTAQQVVAFSTTLPAFTDPEGSTLSYGLVTLPAGLSFTTTTRQISGTPTASGLFVLTYSATDDKGATNSVSFNLTVNPAATTPVTGSFEGYLDKVECGTIRGWVWDRNKPNSPVTVEFYTDGTVWGSVVANIFRDDLKNAGKGNGAHAYSFTVPSELKDGNIHLIRARVSGSTYDLKDSGKPLTCNSPVRLSAESSEGLQVTVLGNPVSNQITVEIRGAEGKPLRFQLTDASGRLISQRQVEVAKPVEQQTFSVSQQSAGVLFLRVNSGLRSVTLKVLKQ